jgi:hypothetical protein
MKMALYMLEPRVPSSPRAMCYDKNNNKVLVCNRGKKVFWFGRE